MSRYQQKQRAEFQSMPEIKPATVRHIRPGDWRDRLSDKKQRDRNLPVNALSPANAWAVRA